MAATKKTKPASLSDGCAEASPQSPTKPVSDFAPSLARQMREIVTAGLNPSSALDLLMRLIAEVPAASKESMDQIKMLDKLINTARAMMETKLKTEEAASIASRIDEMERQLESLTATTRGTTTNSPEE
jgi:hypothetical protein